MFKFACVHASIDKRDASIARGDTVMRQRALTAATGQCYYHAKNLWGLQVYITALKAGKCTSNVLLRRAALPRNYAVPSAV